MLFLLFVVHNRPLSSNLAKDFVLKLSHTTTEYNMRSYGDETPYKLVLYKLQRVINFKSECNEQQ